MRQRKIDRFICPTTCGRAFCDTIRFDQHLHMSGFDLTCMEGHSFISFCPCPDDDNDNLEEPYIWQEGDDERAAELFKKLFPEELFSDD